MKGVETINDNFGQANEIAEESEEKVTIKSKDIYLIL